jgi:hypothetical protein
MAIGEAHRAIVLQTFLTHDHGWFLLSLAGLINCIISNPWLEHAVNVRHQKGIEGSFSSSAGSGSGAGVVLATGTG